MLWMLCAAFAIDVPLNNATTIFQPDDFPNQIRAVPDLDGDGLDELAVGTYSSFNLKLSTHPGIFPTWMFNGNPQVADVNGDGQMDLALGEATWGGDQGRIDFFLGPLQAGIIPAPTVSIVGDSGDYVGGLFTPLADADGDGMPEWAIAINQPAAASAYVMVASSAALGWALTQPTREIRVTPLMPEQPQLWWKVSLSAPVDYLFPGGDLDADGQEELLIPLLQRGLIFQGWASLPRANAGSVREANATALTYPVDTEIISTTLDVSGDGLPDVVANNFDTVWVRYGNPALQGRGTIRLSGGLTWQRSGGYVDHAAVIPDPSGAGTAWLAYRFDARWAGPDTWISAAPFPTGQVVGQRNLRAQVRVVNTPLIESLDFWTSAELDGDPAAEFVVAVRDRGLPTISSF
jgi:hypothetical protein